MKRGTSFLLLLVCFSFVGCQQKNDIFPNIQNGKGVEVSAEANIEKDNDSVPNADYMIPYVDYLRKCNMGDCNYDKYSYKLVFIDADTIPEMVISGGCEACGYMVLTQHRGIVSEMRTWRLGFDYIPNSGLCGYCNGKQSHFYHHIFNIQNGRFVKIIDWDIVIDDSTGHQTHTLNGKPSSEAQAERMVDKLYYSKGTAVDIDSCDRWYSMPRLLEKNIY